MRSPGEEPRQYSEICGSTSPEKDIALPLITVSLGTGRTAEQKREIGEAVYESLRAAIGIPEGDRFFAVREYGPGELVADPGYLGIQRSASPVFVEITLRRGRSTEKKQALYREITDRLAATGLVRPEDVLIVLTENDVADWSFGNGIAQYVQ